MVHLAALGGSLTVAGTRMVRMLVKILTVAGLGVLAVTLLVLWSGRFEGSEHFYE